MSFFRYFKFSRGEKSFMKSAFFFSEMKLNRLNGGEIGHSFLFLFMNEV